MVSLYWVHLEQIRNKIVKQIVYKKITYIHVVVMHPLTVENDGL